MKILYSDEPAFDGVGPAIFLAGPTPRSLNVPSWRTEGIYAKSPSPVAVEILRDLNYEGTVLVPERQNWDEGFDYVTQVAWERAGLEKATVIVFWVPRNMETMLALTTNVEFGYWVAKAPTRILYGRPEGAPHTKYLDWLLKNEMHLDCLPGYFGGIHDKLESLLEEAVYRCKDKFR
jgi:hypothetical protein